jgi:hypothetical protein
MLLKTIGSISCIALLSACGGSSTPTTTGTSTGAGWSSLTTFSDRAGIARGIQNDGRQALVFSEEIALLVKGVNDGPGQIDSINISDQPITATTQYSNIREGTISGGGFTFNTVESEDKKSGTKISYLFEPTSGEAVFGVIGETYGRAPTGSFGYNGTYFVGSRLEALTQLGEVRLVGNFSNDTITIEGASANTRLSGTAIVDTENGRFASSSLTFTSPYNSTYSASTRGLLHGGNSEAASGLFYTTNASSPDYVGAFAASR